MLITQPWLTITVTDMVLSIKIRKILDRKFGLLCYANSTQLSLLALADLAYVSKVREW